MLSANELNPTVEQAAETVSRLAIDFDAHASFYLSPSYQEAQVARILSTNSYLHWGGTLTTEYKRTPLNRK
jgi:hypothetical protein